MDFELSFFLMVMMVYGDKGVYPFFFLFKDALSTLIDDTMELQVDLHEHLLRDHPLNVADLRFLQQSFVTMVMEMMIMREKHLSYFIHATSSENNKPIKMK